MDFKILKEDDVFSTTMFLLYQLTDSPNYSIMGELPYILDKQNLLNFCTYFGGRTIKVPTLDELYSVLNLLMLYQYHKVEKIPYEDALKKLGISKTKRNEIDEAFRNVCSILGKFKFKRGE